MMLQKRTTLNKLLRNSDLKLLQKSKRSIFCYLVDHPNLTPDM